MTLQPILLAGGSGTRLWPLSRADMPKQFLRDFLGRQSLYQHTLQRAASLPDCARPFVVTNAQYAREAAEQAAEIEVEITILEEPSPLGTAPALMLGVFEAWRSDPEAIVMSCNCDNYIPDFEAWRRAVAVGRTSDSLLVLGARPHTSEVLPLGHALLGEELGGGIHGIEAFIEKPSRAQFEALQAGSGKLVWTTGTYLSSCREYIARSQQFAPEWTQAMQKAVRSGEIQQPCLGICELALPGQY